jgi:molecular chaperone GrpE
MRREERIRSQGADGAADFPEGGGDEANVTPEAVETTETATNDLNMVMAERDRYLDQLQRSMAEFANYRRRVDQERAQARVLATRDLLSRLVPIADDFKRALEAVPDDAADAPWIKGVELIERNLHGLLEREQVVPIDALGKPFDPSVHDAIAVDSGSKGSTVVQVFQTGYWHGDQVLRPAVVKVGDSSPNGSDTGDNADDSNATASGMTQSNR